jgi:hypothetical protein
MKFLILLFVLGHLAFAETNFEKVDKLVESVLNKQELYPKEWPKKPHAELIDLNEKVGTDFRSGIAYAATVAATVHATPSEIKKLFDDEHGVMNVVSRVKTLRNFENIEEKPKQARLNLSVKVPVISDFKTREDVRVYQITPEKGVLDARQIGAEGDLDYNRAYVILEKAGEDLHVFVIGVHIVKQEKRVPWLGRGTASSFAKTHYTNYVNALVDALEAQKEK